MYCIFVFDFVWFAAQQMNTRKHETYTFSIIRVQQITWHSLGEQQINSSVFIYFCSDSFRIFVVTDVLNWRKITLMHNLSWKCEFNWKLCFLLLYKLKLISKNYYWISVNDRMWLFPALFHFAETTLHINILSRQTWFYLCYSLLSTSPQNPLQLLIIILSYVLLGQDVTEDLLCFYINKHRLYIANVMNWYLRNKKKTQNEIELSNNLIRLIESNLK